MIVGLRRRVDVEGGMSWGLADMSWGWVGAIWAGGGGWEGRNLKGRLEPGTSVANGSMFDDNIRRGWWWGREKRDGTTS